MNKKIFNELEILTITYKSNEIIEKSLSKINKKFKITVVENSADKQFKKKIESYKNRKCILTGYNLGFGAAFNIGAISNIYVFSDKRDVPCEFILTL